MNPNNSRDQQIITKTCRGMSQIWLEGWWNEMEKKEIDYYETKKGE